MEAAGAFLEAVRQSADQFGNEQMIAWGEASAQLGGLSFEPVRAFWELLTTDRRSESRRVNQCSRSPVPRRVHLITHPNYWCVLYGHLQLKPPRWRVLPSMRG